MLYSKDFLSQLDKQVNKTIYAKVTALKFNESPLESIEGRVTQGSINVDGNSAVRRSCSLTLIADNFSYNDFYWGLNTKFKLEIGVQNTIDTTYPDVIWFNQGIYILTSLNTSRSTNNFTLQLQGKDKMCLLNGEVGGSLESSVDFGAIEEESNDGNWVIRKLPIYDIIRNMVHQYAGEPYHNIVINDLGDYGLELLEYRYDIPMYLYRPADDNNVYSGTNILMDGKKVCWVWRSGSWVKTTLEKLEQTDLDLLVEELSGTPYPNPVAFDKQPVGDPDNNTCYYVAKIEFGQTAGYRRTDLIYAGDLIANVGESITSVLDKIKNMLSEFEYFYDLDGRFVFQRKQSFINTIWTPIHETEDEEKYVESLATASSYSYTFNGGELITAFNNNPNLLNMRNDYSIWGERTGISGAKIPVHMRYAIDQKPVYYKSLDWYDVQEDENGDRYLDKSTITKDSVIYVANEEIYEKVKEEIRNKLLSTITNRVSDFTLTYEMPNQIPEEDRPKTDLEGHIIDSKGWWDIRDWYEYYHALKQEYPNGTMKFYSFNSPEGAYNINPILGREGTYYHWMLIKSATGTLSAGHGGGDPYTSPTSRCYFYDYEDLDADGKPLPGAKPVRQQRKDPVTGDPLWDEKGNPIYISKDMIRPFSGCTDTHTFNYFMETYIDKGQVVYFYNPQFPEATNIKEAIDNQVEEEFNKLIREGKIQLVDWRELIYQMAKDFYHCNDDVYPEKDIFELQIIQNNQLYYPTGLTGYEQYYTDIQGFWRELYNPYLEADIKNIDKEITSKEDEIAETQEALQTIISAALENVLNILNQELDNLKAKREELVIAQEETYFPPDSEDNPGWNRNVFTSPDTLNFWFDFLDTDGELVQFSVKNVGSRPKAINDSNVKSIYFRETPSVVFRTSNEAEKLTGYKYIQIPDIDNMFSISAQGKSAKDRLDELIYQHSYCIESATITTIPIYYLEPNTRIHLFDQDTGLNGDYVISKFTIPLSYNGTMSITATKAAENII